MAIRCHTQVKHAVLVSLAFGVACHRDANAQRSTPSTPVAADRATLVIMAPLGPVFADLQISVAKMPYRTWVGRYLATQMDVDRDDRLTESELELLTENIRRLTGISGPEKILDALSLEQPAADVTVADFAKWLSEKLPKAFDLIAQPQSADDAVRLTSLIDADQNGMVSDAELQAATRTLRFRDLDNDETFSVSELIPYRDPRSQNAAVTPDVVSLPFFHVTGPDSQSLAADRILKRYGHDGVLEAAVLRQTRPAKEGQALRVDPESLQEILAAPEYHLTLDIRLSDNANTSDVNVTVSLSLIHI